MSKNILDSRDLESRKEELLTELEVWKSQLTDDDFLRLTEGFGCEKSELDDEDFLEEWQNTTSDGEEHKSIADLEEEINSSEWRHGLQLIADSYFTQYAEELAEDLGITSSKFQDWPYNCIDWEKAASELQYDYSCVDFDGETYWYRS